MEECEQLPHPDSTEETLTAQFDLQAIRHAYEGLPERWKTVLWYAEVEGLRPREFATLLGLSPKAASQLARRARDGLRAAWLEEHLSDARADSECLGIVQLVIPYHEGRLAEDAHRRVERHLSDCSACQEVSTDSRLVLRTPGLLIGAVVLGSGLAEILFRSASSLASVDAVSKNDHSNAEHSPPHSATGASSPTPMAIASGLTTLLAAAAVTGVLVISPFRPALPAATAPATTGIALADDRTAARSQADEKSSANSSERESDQPEEAHPAPLAGERVANPRQPPLGDEPPTPPSDRPEEPPAPPEVPPADPPLMMLPIPTMTAGPWLSLAGTGAEPGASVEVRATTSAGEHSVIAVAAGADGTWLLPRMSGVPPVGVTLDVRQLMLDDPRRQPSEWRRVITDATFTMWVERYEATPEGAEGRWLLGGWPGATWQLRPADPGDPLLTGAIGADGFASISVPEGLSSGEHSWSYGYLSGGEFLQHAGMLTASAP